MIIIVFLTGILALAGLAIILDFLLWEFQGIKTPAIITDFKPGRFVTLPILVWIKDKETMTATAARIDAVGYFISRPETGGRVRTIVRHTAHSNSPQIRVYGYGPLFLALVLILPFFIVLALWLGNPVLLDRIYYMSMLAGIVGGCFTALRIVRLLY